jgi:hypothetical protein
MSSRGALLANPIAAARTARKAAVCLRCRDARLRGSRFVRGVEPVGASDSGSGRPLVRKRRGDRGAREDFIGLALP